jgi:hypothetical protein
MFVYAFAIELLFKSSQLCNDLCCHTFIMLLLILVAYFPHRRKSELLVHVISGVQ